jgi:hypothetical protein
MLAKQGWRLLSNPDSLCAKFLRGRYYHDTNFLEARIKNNSSHVWKAILHGRESLKEGLIKRVGFGGAISNYDREFLREVIIILSSNCKLSLPMVVRSLWWNQPISRFKS